MKALLIVSIILSSSFAFGEENASYQEEFIFLKNQLKSIKDRKSKTVKQLKAMELELTRKNTALGASVAKYSAQRDVLQTRLSKFDENRSSKEFSEKKINVVKDQMKEVALKHSLGSENFETLNQGFINYLKQGASIHKKDEVAFNKEGVEVKGESLNFGHTASFFKENGMYQSLVRGKTQEGLYFGSLNIKEPKVTEGQSLFIPIEFKDGSVSVAKTFSSVLSEKLEAGGAVGYIIILLGFIGLGVAFIRYGLINIYSKFDDLAVREIVKHAQKGNIDKAKEVLYKQKTDPITYFIDTLFVNRHKDAEVYEAIVIHEISKVQSKVSKYGPYLIVLAAVAPLLGLLGTVTGMIGTFEMITVHGTGNPKILSGGIKEALVTTQMGLIVAIPCILAGNFLSSKATKIVGKFEEVASSIPKV